MGLVAIETKSFDWDITTNEGRHQNGATQSSKANL